MPKNEYVITIANETENTQSSPIAGSTAQSKSAKKSSDLDSAKKVLAIKHAVMPFVNQFASNRISIVSLSTGAKEHQERLSFAYSIAQQASNAAMSVATGAAFGGLPGAIIGLVTSAATSALNYGYKTRTLQMQRDIENVELRYSNIRAGGAVASYSKSRLRNQ